MRSHAKSWPSHTTLLADVISISLGMAGPREPCRRRSSAVKPVQAGPSAGAYETDGGRRGEEDDMVAHGKACA
ncbi:MAG TPA: hypothetical protein VK771_09750, partial [Acidimicrobiia bacterium]|nr:hypothetical protein [Acidimicrobiia bacterium]